MRIFIISIVFLFGALPTSAFSESWVNLTKIETAELFFDLDSIQGNSEDKNINIKVNMLGEAQGGVKSKFWSFTVNCNEASYLLKISKDYDLTNLSGVEKIFNTQNEKREIPNPKSVGGDIIAVACKKIPTESATTFQNNDKKIEGLKFTQIMDIAELKKMIINSGYSQEDIDTFQYYYSFVWHTQQKININIEGKNKKENYDVNGLNAMLPYKNSIDKLIFDMDSYLNNIATVIGVNDETILKVFGLEKNNKESYFKLNLQLNRVGNGRVASDQYWSRHACNKCMRVSKFFDEQDPNVLFDKTLRIFVNPKDLQKIKIYMSKLEDENKNKIIYGDNNLRSILAKNWPHWEKKEIEHAINSEAMNILKKQPDLSIDLINKSVTELWMQRIKSKNNPGSDSDANTFAKKKGFRGAPFNKIDSSIELVAACVANNVNFLNKSKGTNFDTKGFREWTSCTMQKSINDPKYSTNFEKWSKYFNNEIPATLQILGDICMKNIIVTYAGGSCYSADYRY